MSTGRSFDFLFNQLRNGSEGALASGSIEFYAAGTTTPKAVWTDVGLTQPSTTGILTPYTLTADGTAALFGDGLYKIVIKDSTGVTIYTYDHVEALSYYNIPNTSQTITLDASTGNVNTTFTPTQDVIAYRADNSGTYTATLTLPTGYSIAGNGAATYSLTQEGETVHLFLPSTGTVYYVV